MGDYYTLKSPWYWVIQAFTITYALSILAYAVLILNTRVTDTYFPATLVNSYYTQRYISVTWYALLFAAAHLLMYPIVMMMITFRRSHGCSVFWFSLIFILLVMSSYTVLTLARDYKACNNPSGDQRDNLCNDKRWCCAPEVNSNTANACPFSGGVVCPDIPEISSVNDLRPDLDFLWLFWTNFVYWVADVFIVLFFLGMFCVAPFPAAPPHSRSNTINASLTIEAQAKRSAHLKYTKPE